MILNIRMRKLLVTAVVLGLVVIPLLSNNIKAVSAAPGLSPIISKPDGHHYGPVSEYHYAPYDDLVVTLGVRTWVGTGITNSYLVDFEPILETSVNPDWELYNYWPTEWKRYYIKHVKLTWSLYYYGYPGISARYIGVNEGELSDRSAYRRTEDRPGGNDPDAVATYIFQFLADLASTIPAPYNPSGLLKYVDLNPGYGSFSSGSYSNPERWWVKHTQNDGINGGYTFPERTVKVRTRFRLPSAAYGTYRFQIMWEVKIQQYHFHRWQPNSVTTIGTRTGTYNLYFAYKYETPSSPPGPPGPGPGPTPI